jgi:molybdate transport system ATP-binding protein
MSLAVAVRHRFDGFALDVAFEAPAGVTVLFGRSGSGKTTVVNTVAGLLRPAEGRVVVAGRTLLDTAARIMVPPHRRRVGYVFQEGRLFPHLTVRQNLAYGRWFSGGAEDGAETRRIVDLLGIAPLLDRRPRLLSGGEKQRVAIGRALLARPALLLMDEPLASLDQARKDEVLPFLERIRDATAVPVLYVSHDVGEVARLATTVVVLDAGRVARAGRAAEVLSDPAAAPALGVREAGAVLEARVVAHHADGISELALAGGRLLLPAVAAAPGASVRVRIHAQDVILSRGAPEGLSALNILPATVTAVRPGDGPGVMVQLALGRAAGGGAADGGAAGDLILARLTRRSAEAMALAPGVGCHAILKSVAVAQGDVWGAPLVA